MTPEIKKTSESNSLVFSDITALIYTLAERTVTEEDLQHTAHWGGCVFFFFLLLSSPSKSNEVFQYQVCIRTGTLKHLHKLNTTYLSTQLSNRKIRSELSLSNINITDNIHSQQTLFYFRPVHQDQLFKHLAKGQTRVRAPAMCFNTLIIHSTVTQNSKFFMINKGKILCVLLL